MSRTSARRCAKQDPENAETYAANAAAYSEKIRATVEPIRAALAAIPEDRRWLVTSEGAFSYLARDFGLKELYLWPINADQQGTPQQVRKVIDAVRANNIPAVFSRKHRVAGPGRAGGARDRSEIWRRALCGFAQRGRRPRADLSRSAARHRRNDRQGIRRSERTDRKPGRDAASRCGAGIAVENVTVTYRNGQTALRDASFAIPRGTITALVGVNGSGKSTLFKAIMGFVRLAKARSSISASRSPKR